MSPEEIIELWLYRHDGGKNFDSMREAALALIIKLDDSGYFLTKRQKAD